MNNVYHIDKPYPQLLGLAENKRAGRLLLKSYSGACSEMTAVNQYMYHYLKSEGEYVQVSEALRYLAESELKHLYLLGACIRQLGVNPVLRNENRDGANYWTARCISYDNDTKDMLISDIASEQEQIRQYEHAIQRINNTQIQGLLTRILEDERLHVQILTGLYNRYF